MSALLEGDVADRQVQPAALAERRGQRRRLERARRGDHGELVLPAHELAHLARLAGTASASQAAPHAPPMPVTTVCPTAKPAVTGTPAAARSRASTARRRSAAARGRAASRWSRSTNVSVPRAASLPLDRAPSKATCADGLARRLDASPRAPGDRPARLAA